MIYHGVKSEEGVLMRMNNIPRSIAESMGGSGTLQATLIWPSVQSARAFISSSDIALWDRGRPTNSPLSGAEYQSVWHTLSGEGR